MLDVVLSALARVGGLLVLGGAVRLCLGGSLRLPPGLGVTAGAGLASTVVTVSLVFAAGGDALRAVA